MEPFTIDYNELKEQSKKVIFEVYWLRWLSCYDYSMADEIYEGFGDTLKDVLLRYKMSGRPHWDWLHTRYEIREKTHILGIEQTGACGVQIQLPEMHLLYDSFESKLNNPNTRLKDLFPPALEESTNVRSR